MTSHYSQNPLSIDYSHPTVTISEEKRREEKRREEKRREEKRREEKRRGVLVDFPLFTEPPFN